MLGDWQIFWERHRERPPLATSVQLGAYETEVMLDDGQIVRRKSPGAAVLIQRAMKDAIIEQVRERRAKELSQC